MKSEVSETLNNSTDAKPQYRQMFTPELCKPTIGKLRWLHLRFNADVDFHCLRK